MLKPDKEKFVTAYTYCYGETIKRAREVFKSASTEYINAVIESFEHDSKLSFYND